MPKYVSLDTIVAALRILRDLELRRAGRTALTGYLLLKAKQRTRSGQWIEVTSKGGSSVEPELARFIRVAPGTLLPDIIPFGSHDGGIEYLAQEYERRGTYTHLYPGRNLAAVVDVRKAGRAFEVRVPRSAVTNVVAALGSRIPLEPTAAFFMRKEQFDGSPTKQDVIDRFRATFDLDTTELSTLFEATTFVIDFADTPADLPAGLPLDLQPKTVATSHASAARVERSVLATVDSSGEVFVSEKDERRIERAFRSSKAIALVGPPGTGKSAKLAQVLQSAAADPTALGLKNPPTYLIVTADADWTSRTVIGGYYPNESGRLVFREGALLQALRNNQMLWVDEMNRADLDRVLGPVMTFLTGQAVDLGPTHLGEETEAKKMVLVWAKDAASGVREDDEQRVYYAGTDWRLLGTYNNVDRGRVFPMGSALQRRWALVPIAPVDTEIASSALVKLGIRPPISAVLLAAYNLHQEYLPIGLAPFIDIARYVGTDPDSDPTDPVTQEEHNLLCDGYVLFLGQQLARLDPSRREEFFDGLSSILGTELADEAASF